MAPHVHTNSQACPPDEALEAYLCGSTSDIDSSSIDLHLKSCPRCESWVRDARADDELLGAVRNVLTAEQDRRDRSSSVHGSARSAAAQAQSPRVEGYDIGARLGEGGMGVVFEARQINPPRPVALKLIRSSRLLDDHALRLFDREARALARLRHPAIATIFDAGVTTAGNHYFAMELVRGVPLLEFAQREKLPLRRRIALFRRVCDAVQYAHQRGVIHRDLKPSNILVEPDGTVKVLDFGLARINDPDDSSATLLTESGRVQGTLAYMSPEQARGRTDEIDARTDVYSLGVILFQLLTDEMPYDLSRAALHEAVRTICEQAPRRPSATAPALRGDLDVILLKALAKDPAQRYSSAAALSEDLERFLANQPILARPPSTAYQLRKLVARNKVATSVAMAIFIATIGFGAWMRTLYLQADELRIDAELARQHAEQQRIAADHAREHAQEAAATSAEVQQFLQNMISSVDPEQARGRDPGMLRDLLDQAALRAETQLAERPAVAAVVLGTLGKTYYRLGEYEKAEAQQRAALRTRRERLPEEKAQLAGLLNDISDTFRTRQKLEEAEAASAESLKILRETDRTESSDYAISLARHSQIRFDRGAHDEGEKLAGEALELQRRLIGPDDVRLASGLNTHALQLTGRGRFKEALPLTEEALELQKRTIGDDHPDTARTMNNLGHLLTQLGQLDRADAVLTETLNIRRHVLGEAHGDTVLTINNLAMVKGTRKEYAEAEALFREALDGFRRSVGPEHARVAVALNNIAQMLQAQNRMEEAIDYFQQALEMRKRLFGEDNPEVAMAYQNLASAVGASGDLDRSEELFRTALGIAARILPPDHIHLAIYRSNFAQFLILKRQRPEEALPYLLDATPVLRKSFGDRHDRTKQAFENLVRVYLATNQSESAAEFRALLTAATQPAP